MSIAAAQQRLAHQTLQVYKYSRIPPSWSSFSSLDLVAHFRLNVVNTNHMQQPPPPPCRIKKLTDLEASSGPRFDALSIHLDSDSVAYDTGDLISGSLSITPNEDTTLDSVQLELRLDEIVKPSLNKHSSTVALFTSPPTWSGIPLEYGSSYTFDFEMVIPDAAENGRRLPPSMGSLGSLGTPVLGSLPHSSDQYSSGIDYSYDDADTVYIGYSLIATVYRSRGIAGGSDGHQEPIQRMRILELRPSLRPQDEQQLKSLADYYGRPIYHDTYIKATYFKRTSSIFASMKQNSMHCLELIKIGNDPIDVSDKLSTISLQLRLTGNKLTSYPPPRVISVEYSIIADTLFTTKESRQLLTYDNPNISNESIQVSHYKYDVVSSDEEWDYQGSSLIKDLSIPVYHPMKDLTPSFISTLTSRQYRLIFVVHLAGCLSQDKPNWLGGSKQYRIISLQVPVLLTNTSRRPEDIDIMPSLYRSTSNTPSEWSQSTTNSSATVEPCLQEHNSYDGTKSFFITQVAETEPPEYA